MSKPKRRRWTADQKLKILLETPQFPPPDGGEGRSEKAKCRTSDTHDCGESDDLIVPTKQANKAETSAAESVEGSGSTKGNAFQMATCRT